MTDIQYLTITGPGAKGEKIPRLPEARHLEEPPVDFQIEIGIIRVGDCAGRNVGELYKQIIPGLKCITPQYAAAVCRALRARIIAGDRFALMCDVDKEAVGSFFNEHLPLLSKQQGKSTPIIGGIYLANCDTWPPSLYLVYLREGSDAI